MYHRVPQSLTKIRGENLTLKMLKKSMIMIGKIYYGICQLLYLFYLSFINIVLAYLVFLIEWALNWPGLKNVI